MKFVNTVHPYFGVYNPVSGQVVRFVGGVLDLDEDDPNYRWVKAEAERNPNISIHEKVTTCAYCGEVFTGKVAAAELGKHVKAVHFDRWQADQDAKVAAEREVQIKSRAGFVCDVCQPVQEFGTAEDLAAHVRLLHANAPELTESGETKGAVDQPDGAPTGDTTIPAATPSGG